MSSPGEGPPPAGDDPPRPGASPAGEEQHGSGGDQAAPGHGPAAPAPPRPSSDRGGDVGATLRDMWATRPARLRDDRKIGGVCAAIARRYAIDPTLVRVAFVVAAFYGVGLLLYLAGLLVLPRIDDRGHRRESPVLAVVVGVILAVIAIGAVFGGNAGTAVGVIVVLLLLYALHRSRGRVVAAAGGPAMAGASASASMSAPAGAAGSAERPPSWDPLGAAPFAWDLPEPAAPPPPPDRRSRVTPVTLGAALLAAGAVLALGLVGVLPLGVTPVVGTALAVLGAGLLVGAFLQHGRGLLFAAVPLALILAVAAGAGNGPWRGGTPPWVDDDTGAVQSAGNAAWAPTTAVAPIYETGFGNADLDLRGVPAGPPVRTTVRSGAGNVTVLVPATADVTADCQSGAGRVDCLGRGDGDVLDLGPDGPGGPVIDLHAMSGAGNVEVRRG